MVDLICLRSLDSEASPSIECCLVLIAVATFPLASFEEDKTFIRTNLPFLQRNCRFTLSNDPPSQAKCQT